MKRKKNKRDDWDDMDDMDDMDELDELDELDNMDVMGSLVRFLSGYYTGRKFSDKTIYVDVSKCKSTHEANELADAEAWKRGVLHVVKVGMDELPINKAERREMQRKTQKYKIGDIVRLTEIAIRELDIEGFDEVRQPLVVTGVKRFETDYGPDWWYDLKQPDGKGCSYPVHYLKKYDGSEDDEDIPYEPRNYVEMTQGDKYYKQEEDHKKHPSTFRGTGYTIEDGEYDEGEIGPP